MSAAGLRAARALAVPAPTMFLRRSIHTAGAGARAAAASPSSASSSSAASRLCASFFTNAAVHSARSSKPTPLSSRGMHTTATALQRQVLGRIVPKRVAIPRSEGMSGDAGMPTRSIWRPVVFCVGLSAVVYAWAAESTNETTSTWLARVTRQSYLGIKASLPSDMALWRARQVEATEKAQQRINALPQVLSFLPAALLQPIMHIAVMWEESTLNRPIMREPIVQILTVFGIVFLGWKTRRLEPFMRKWFLHRPVILGGGAKREWANCVTMLTSVFSHNTLPHLAFNSLALYSFGSVANKYLISSDMEPPRLSNADPTPHFIAFFIAAGLFASLASHCWTNIVRLPRLLRSLQSPARLSSTQALAAHQAILPSLGASGAIYACVTIVALANPEMSVSLIFLPFVAIPISYGVGGMVLLDLVGLIRGWSMFDHVAHLGGALFGVVYYQYGRQWWEWLRIKMGAKPYY